MKTILKIGLVIVLFLSIAIIVKDLVYAQKKDDGEKKMNYEVQKSDEEWKKILSPEEYNVLREKGTERPFTGEYNLHFEKGDYYCRACGNLLFNSDTKFESHCGWPSFSNVDSKSAIILKEDRSFGMIRTEVLCAKCGGHLGHLFDDGPKPTGMRYCINSVSISFKKDSTIKDSIK